MALDSTSAALAVAIETGDLWKKSAEEYRIASETKDAIIRHERSVTRRYQLTTLGSLALNVVQAIR